MNARLLPFSRRSSSSSRLRDLLAAVSAILSTRVVGTS